MRAAGKSPDTLRVMIPISRQRNSLFVLFFLPGLGLASWVTRTPSIRDSLNATVGEMGLVLLGLAIGSLLGILSAGTLVARLGPRVVTTMGAPAVALSLPVIGLATVLPSSVPARPVLAAAGLFVFGVGMAIIEIALNVLAAEMERVTGRVIIPVMHGFYSMGLAVGALAGTGAAALAVPVWLHMLSAALISLLAGAWGVAGLPGERLRIRRRRSDSISMASPLMTGEIPIIGADEEPVPVSTHRQLLRNPTVVILALSALSLALAEGAANDWLPLIMVDDHNLSETGGSFMFAGFAIAMTIACFAGSALISRFGRPLLFLLCCAATLAGIGTIILSTNPVLAVIAVILWGLGVSLSFPIAISAAGDTDDNPTARVSIVATAGYAAYLVGPPLLGLIGDHVGLRGALLLPLACVAAAVAAAPVTRSR